MLREVFSLHSLLPVGGDGANLVDTEVGQGGRTMEKIVVAVVINVTLEIQQRASRDADLENTAWYSSLSVLRAYLCSGAPTIIRREILWRPAPVG